MEQLTENYWKDFKKDGIMFENMCGELLKNMTNGSFKNTPYKKDGSKDYVVIENNDLTNSIIFGESKFHKRDLSIQAISSTLVMAYVSRVNAIYFFSYSKITKETKHRISDFCYLSGIAFHIYDDIKLEELILSQPKILEKYFHKKVDFIYHSHGVSFDVVIGHKNDVFEYFESSDKTFYVNDQLVLKVYCSNQSLIKEQDIKIEFINDYLDNYELLNHSEFEFTLKKAETSAFTAVFRITHYSSNLFSPTVIVKINKTKNILPKKDIICNWLAESPLVGSTNINYLEEIELKYLEKNNASFINLYGKSGVGKSRLVEEIIFKLEKHDYKYIFIDTDISNISFKYFIKKITAFNEKLPIYLNDDENKIKIKGQLPSIVNNILYDSQFNIEEHLEEVVEYVFSIFEKNKIAIILDNFQNLDKIFNEFYEKLIVLLSTNYAKGIFITTFNLDRITFYPNKQNLLNHINILSEKNKSYFFSREICDFDENYAEIFLRNCLHCKNEIEYSNTIKYIIEKVGTNPFYLQQMLLLLLQKKIITPSNKGYFYINNIATFHDEIDSIPKTIKLLLSEKHKQLIRFLNQNYNNSEEELKVLITFMVKLKSVSRKDLKNFISEHIIDKAISCGIFKINQDILTFAHINILLYYDELFDYSSISNELWNKLFIYMNDKNLDLHSFEPYFNIAYYLNELNDKIIQDAIHLAKDKSISDLYRYEFTNNLLTILLKRCKNKIDFNYLDIILILCVNIENNLGIKLANAELEKVIHIIDLYHPTESSEFDIMKEFYFLCINNYIQLYDNKHANKNIERLERKMNLLPSDDKILMKARIKILNRKAVISKSESINNSINYLLEALTLCKKINDYFLEIELYNELGNTYYYIQDKDNSIKYWNKAYQIYNEYFYGDNDYLHITTNIDRGLACILNNKSDEAENISLDLLDYVNKTDLPYYEIKILLYRCLCILMYNNINNKNEEFESFITKAQDLIVLHNRERLYYKSFFFLACYLKRIHQYDLAEDNFQTSLNLLNNIINSRENANYFILDIQEIIYQILLINNEFKPKQIYEDEEVKKSIVNLLKLKQKDLKLYYNIMNHSLLHDENNGVSYPFI